VLLDPMALDLPEEMPELQASDVSLYNTYLSVFGDDVQPTNPHVWEGFSPIHYLFPEPAQADFLIALSGDPVPPSPDFVAAQKFTKILRDSHIPVKFVQLKYLDDKTINSDLGKPAEPLTNIVMQFMANPAGYASGAGLPQE
jgi:hypothetical protein